MEVVYYSGSSLELYLNDLCPSGVTSLGFFVAIETDLQYTL